jgi:hypothetical protein
MDGDSLTRWSALASLALYTAALGLRLLRHPRPARTSWTLGFLFFAGHMVAAFHFHHHWSHDEAYAFTARQTAAMTGLDWGGGLYANYIFALVWAGDFVWWWRRRGSYESRSWAVEAIVQGYLAFMWFNATIVFGSWTGRVAGFISLLAVLILVVLTRRR